MFETIDVSERKGNKFDDLTGRKFGRLTVIGLSPKMSGRKSYWVCVCECGKKKVVRSDLLKSKNTQSCGCLRDEAALKTITKYHEKDKNKGAGKSRLYHTWQHMKYRCNNPNSGSYAFYGGRGIKLCEEWENDFQSFKKWSLDNGYAEGLTIERKDVNGNYEPSNCEWITLEDQMHNRRTTVWIEWNGKTQNLKQWSDELGINYGTLWSRYNRSGMRPPELFAPVKKR